MKLSASNKKTIQLIVSYLFIILYVYSSASKLLEFHDFQTQLGQSPLLGSYAIIISYGVIVLEITISVLLIFEKSRKIGLFAAYTLMVMFTAYIIIILNFTAFTPCSCGGVLESMGWTEHLIFNIAFIVLALVAVYEKSALKLLIVLFGSGIFSVTILFLLSEKEIKQNNAFQRKYIPHGLQKIGSYQLESNAYYIAGVDDSLIYLGNYNAPLILKAVMRNLKKSEFIDIVFDAYDLPYKRLLIEVNSPYFYMADGSVPVLFRGSVTDWKTKLFMKDKAYFQQFKSVDSSKLIFTTTSSKTKSTALGVFLNLDDSVSFKLSEGIIKKQIEGTFDTDGILLWNKERRQSIYVYYYRNQYEITDSDLHPFSRGKTIDTISKANIDVAYYKKDKTYKKGKSTLVNLFAATWGNNLMIHSDRLGKHESADVLESASIIDHYDILKIEYIQSFYFYHQYNQKLKEFRLVNDTIIAIVDDKLWMYKIKPKYFRN